MNRALCTSIASIAAAQLIKIPGSLKDRGSWHWEDLWMTGGMPSSHSAAVASMASYIGLKRGLDSLAFSLASMLALIVMYDAMGIRRHTGLIAMEVNELEDTVVRLAEKYPPVTHQRKEKNLEERLGHLPEEVVGGAVLGMAIGILSYLTEPKKRTIRGISSRLLSLLPYR